jgi:hypothetical protein
MVRRSPLRHVTMLTTATLVALVMGATINCAGAGSRRDRQYDDDRLFDQDRPYDRNRQDDQDRPDSEAGQGAIAGPPVMAIVSIKDQRVSLYDANGSALRARVSTGRTDYETPVGIYSVLEKEEEHYSNVYDDASMPFMQRLTWSGLSLHAGVLPGYPASHGCVRMPNGFAEQIFPLTKVGMRVIVAHDDVAPAEVSHAFLAKLSPAIVSAASATAASYEAQGSNPEDDSPFQPDVHNWPAQQARFDAVKAIAAEKAAEAAAATAHANDLKRASAKKFAQRGKAAKALRVAEFAKRAADKNVADADKEIAGAKTPAATKRWEEAKGKALTAATDAAAKLVVATAALQSAEDELAHAKQDEAPAEAARVAAANAAKDAQRKTVPVSLFISLKTQRLYVRQGYEPVFDAPVTIAEPEKPIGTHIYTAVDYVNQGKDVRWTVVSLERRTPDDAEADLGRKHRRSDSVVAAMPSDLPSANAALDRVTLPPDVLARVSESVWPGSSLIVSDEEMSKETGNATDFIVLISGEPQGGLKKRPHQGPSAGFYRYEADDNFYGDDRYYRRRRYRGGGFFNLWQ